MDVDERREIVRHLEREPIGLTLPPAREPPPRRAARASSSSAATSSTRGSHGRVGDVRAEHGPEHEHADHGAGDREHGSLRDVAVAPVAELVRDDEPQPAELAALEQRVVEDEPARRDRARRRMRSPWSCAGSRRRRARRGPARRRARRARAGRRRARASASGSNRLKTGSSTTGATKLSSSTRSAAATAAGTAHQPGNARASATSPSIPSAESSTPIASPFTRSSAQRPARLRREAVAALAHEAAPVGERRPHDRADDDDEHGQQQRRGRPRAPDRRPHEREEAENAEREREVERQGQVERAVVGTRALDLLRCEGGHTFNGGRSDQNAQCGVGRAAAGEELGREMQVDVLVHREHQRVLEAEAGAPQLVPAPAQRRGRSRSRSASSESIWAVARLIVILLGRKESRPAARGRLSCVRSTPAASGPTSNCLTCSHRMGAGDDQFYAPRPELHESPFGWFIGSLHFHPQGA